MFLFPLSDNLAKATERADLTVSSGSFFLRLLAFSTSFCLLSREEEDSAFILKDVSGLAGLFWTEASGMVCRLDSTRLNGSWKVSNRRLTCQEAYKIFRVLLVYIIELSYQIRQQQPKKYNYDSLSYSTFAW
jgi:hypothetical protein